MSGSVIIRGVRPYGEGEPVDVLITDGIVDAIGADVSAPEFAA